MSFPLGLFSFYYDDSIVSTTMAAKINMLLFCV
jgi:hypothetical protein